MKKIVLDTNAYVRLLVGDEQVLSVLANADAVYVPAAVLGELYAGFKGGMREIDNNRRLEQFLQKETVHILPSTQHTAAVFGEIKYNLKTAGTPLPINDVWIAAHAVEAGAYLITFDKHYLKVPGLLLWSHPALGDT